MDKQPLDSRIILRLHSDQKDEIRRAAAADRRSTSDWIRVTLEDAAARVLDNRERDDLAAAS